MTASTLNSIMLPVRDDGKGTNVLKHAAVLAKAFEARVRIVHCHPKPDDLMPYGVVIPSLLRQQIEKTAASNADLTRDQMVDDFRNLAEELGLAVQDHVAGKATTRFIEYEGKQLDAVQRYGRLADLICVSQPDPKSNLGVNTLKSALFSSGRPVMICPEQKEVAQDFADHVAIGWNGSLEATRAVALTAPIISNAQAVTILSTGEPQDNRQPGAEHLQRYLQLRGVASDIRQFEAVGKNVGSQLLSESRAIGAGLLIIGAYHDSYERETLFGGNSQAVVAGADFPVVLVH